MANEEIKYPRWVQRSPDIGAVLCHSAKEEAELLADWKARSKPAEAETTKAVEKK